MRPCLAVAQHPFPISALDLVPSCHALGGHGYRRQRLLIYDLMVGMILEPRKRDGCGVRNIFCDVLLNLSSSRSGQFYIKAIKTIGPISFSTYGSKNLTLWVYPQQRQTSIFDACSACFSITARR